MSRGFMSVIDRFEQVLLNFPEHRSLESTEEKLSYRELADRISRLASSFQLHELKKGDRVLIEISKSLDYIVALFAVWKLGAVAIPLDPELPTERKQFIVDDSQAKFCLVNNDDCGNYSHVQKLNVTAHESLLLDCRKVVVNESDSAYIIYTSGSTGQAKGVELSHAGLLAVVSEQIDIFKLHSQSRSLFYLSTSFDASLSDIGTALLSGACLVILPKCFLHIDKLAETLNSYQITYIDLPPSLLKLLDHQSFYPYLETIVIGGEVCDPQTVREWSKKLRLINVYGPTEATICTSYTICDETWEEALIGRPMNGVIYRIDENDELLISSLGLAKSYLNNEALNNQKFVLKNGRRFYRTGDRVRALVDGNYEFLGRLDRQVKFNGQLIELDEIECHLNNHEKVQESAVFISSQKLIAVLVAENFSESQVKEYLSSKVPKWMLPNIIQVFDSIPRNSSQKIDYQFLRQNFEDRSFTKLDDPLLSLFQDYLKRDLLAMDNLFDMGLDSFGVMELSVLAESKGFALNPAMISELKTVQAIKEALDEKRSSGCLKREFLDKEFRKLKEKIVSYEATPDSSSSSLGIGLGSKVLYTGATGFLGARVLKDLLERTNSEFTCLVRCKDSEQGLWRIQEAVPDFKSEWLEHINVIPADLSQESLGLSVECLHNLAGSMDSIIHNAAEVNTIKTYEDLLAVNVLSTLSLLNLARNQKSKTFHYASTLSVFVSTDFMKRELTESSDLSEITEVYGGYAQSKFVSELLVLEAQKQGSAISTYRFGLLTGDSESAETAKNDFLSEFIRGTIQSACKAELHSDDLLIDITPVDYAAKAMSLLSQNSRAQIWHIANPKSLSLTALYSLIEEEKSLESMAVDDWKEHLSKLSCQSAKSTYLNLSRLNEQSYKTGQRTMDLFQATGFKFSSAWTFNQLEKLGLNFPQVFPHVIKKYITKELCS